MWAFVSVSKEQMCKWQRDPKIPLARQLSSLWMSCWQCITQPTHFLVFLLLPFRRHFLPGTMSIFFLDFSSLYYPSIPPSVLCVGLRVFTSQVVEVLQGVSKALAIFPKAQSTGTFHQSLQGPLRHGSA